MIEVSLDPRESMLSTPSSYGNEQAWYFQLSPESDHFFNWLCRNGFLTFEDGQCRVDYVDQ